ncbi:MAG: GNAT family N-acetyltransferase [Ignavibacteria bacterium]|nr:GNAT family N-acetyltransferase [Ignavibacteria bacterium]
MTELNKIKNIKIRKAKRSDSKSILKLITELAEFEKLTPPGKAASDRLLKDAFSKKPLFRIILAETNHEVIGYAFYFFTYSSFLAKRTLYLEDIFITEKFRSKGIGRLFFKKLINIARKNKCGRMEWVVLDWNANAIKFYENLGAGELKEWKTFRFSF